jgi:hypothetical protein
VVNNVEDVGDGGGVAVLFFCSWSKDLSELLLL